MKWDNSAEAKARRMLAGTIMPPSLYAQFIRQLTLDFLSDEGESDERAHGEFVGDEEATDGTE